MSSVTEEIKARVDLVELIGRTVPLKKVGSAYRGLCPFHTEKTPSFYIRPQTQTYRCFGCNKSGSAFDWLMEREHLDFPEALRTLANITGVALPERRSPDQEEHTRRLYTIIEKAQTFYEAALWGTIGERARAYLARRGLTDETLRSFGVGFAPNGNPLLRHLESDGVSEQDLQGAGVIGVADDGRRYDFFRDRVLFPVRDAQGHTIAFGGRSLEDGVNPKYINTRDTLLFHKQENLFAFDLARRQIGQDKQAVIVEGYMDALMAHQHGYRNVVATLGTAVTERQLRLLARQAEDILYLHGFRCGRRCGELARLASRGRKPQARVHARGRAESSAATHRGCPIGTTAGHGAAEGEGSRRLDSIGSSQLAETGEQRYAGYRLRAAANGRAPRPGECSWQGGRGGRDRRCAGNGGRSSGTGQSSGGGCESPGHSARGDVVEH